jgi:hypothetical protein
MPGEMLTDKSRCAKLRRVFLIQSIAHEATQNNTEFIANFFVLLRVTSWKKNLEA